MAKCVVGEYGELAPSYGQRRKGSWCLNNLQWVSKYDQREKYYKESKNQKNRKAWIQHVLTCSNILHVKEDLGIYLDIFKDLKQKLIPCLWPIKWQHNELNEVVGAFVHVLMKGRGFNNIKSKLEWLTSIIAIYFWWCTCAFFKHIYSQEVCGLSEDTLLYSS